MENIGAQFVVLGRPFLYSNLFQPLSDPIYMCIVYTIYSLIGVYTYVPTIIYVQFTNFIFMDKKYKSITCRLHKYILFILNCKYQIVLFWVMCIQGYPNGSLSIVVQHFWVLAYCVLCKIISV